MPSIYTQTNSLGHDWVVRTSKQNGFPWYGDQAILFLYIYLIRRKQLRKGKISQKIFYTTAGENKLEFIAEANASGEKAIYKCLYIEMYV